jgi:Cd2+/Zn2+-exporting ATPase
MEWELNQLEHVSSAQVDILKASIDIEFEGDTQAMRELVEQIGKRYESGFALIQENKEAEIEEPEAIWHRLNYLLPRISATLLLLLLGSTVLTGGISVAAFVLSYLLAGGDVIWRALDRLRRGDVFHEYFLMSLATLGAFAIGEYQEAVAVMVFYQIGEYLQDKAVEHSKDSIEALMNQRIPLARVLRGGKLFELNPEDISVGEQILVRPGEEVPLDGILLQGVTSVNNAAITGESMPQALQEGDEVTAGAINLDGVIKLTVVKSFQNSGMARVMRLMRDAKSKKPSTERFISRFARIYTKVVVLLAVLTAVLPPLLTGGEFSVYIYRALIFLVVSCPCALVISVPLGFFAGMGGFSKKNLLIKDPNAIEQLSQVKHISFDKTNTLTQGKFQLKTVEATDGNQASLLHIIRSVENHSNHPLARAIVQVATEDKQKLLEFDQVQETAGQGVTATIGEEQYLVGNESWLKKLDVEIPDLALNGTYIYAAKNTSYLGRIQMEDALKEDAANNLDKLRKLGVKSLIMLTGDNEIHARTVAAELGLDGFQANLKPEDKLAWLQERSGKEQNKMAFVGDGINDAPALVAADIGIAMGIKGTDLAIEAAQLVVMHDKLEDLPTALILARRSMRIIRQNIFFAVGLKVLVMALGLFGLADMWMAVFADVGVTMLAVLNSMRLLR